MTLRRYAEFDTDVIDHSLEEEDFEEFLKLAGLAVADQLIGMLRRPDRKTTTPDYLGDGRWQFEVKTGWRTLFFRVELMEQVLLVTGDVSLQRLFFRRDRAKLAEVLDQLNEDLRRDTRVRNIKWCTKDEILGEGPGASSPTAA
jgi:hypothetical protein